MLRAYTCFQQISGKKFLMRSSIRILWNLKGQRNNDCLQIVLININISTLNGGKWTSCIVEEQIKVSEHLTFPATFPIYWSTFHSTHVWWNIRCETFERERRGAKIGRTNKKKKKEFDLNSSESMIHCCLVSTSVQLHEITKRCENKNFQKRKKLSLQLRINIFISFNRYCE